MAVLRRLIIPSTAHKQQWLKVDHKTRFMSVRSDKWLTLFGPDSELSASTQVVKIAAKFNDTTFSDIQFTAYLYDQNNGSIANASSCSIQIFKVSSPDWTDVPVSVVATTQLANNYFYTNISLSSLGISFQGGDSLMLEASIFRLGIAYRDRIYVNHLGIYDNVTRLRQDVEFLEITKKDL